MKQKGYFGIGIYHPAKECNIGTLFRSAHNFGAAFIYTIGRRYKRQASDTTNASKQIPCFEFETFEQFKAAQPKECPLIAIELDEKSIPIKRFCHPYQANYLLGNESTGIPRDILDQCNAIVQLPGLRCLNVSVSGSIVLYDRLSKHEK